MSLEGAVLTSYFAEFVAFLFVKLKIEVLKCDEIV